MPGLRPHRFRRASGGRTASGRKIRQPCSQLGNSVIVPRSHDWTNAIPTVQRHVTGQGHGVRRKATCAEKPRMHKTTAEKPRMHKTNRIWVLSLPDMGCPGPYQCTAAAQILLVANRPNLGSIFGRCSVPGPISNQCFCCCGRRSLSSCSSSCCCSCRSCCKTKCGGAAFDGMGGEAAFSGLGCGAAFRGSSGDADRTHHSACRKTAGGALYPGYFGASDCCCCCCCCCCIASHSFRCAC